ncbi:hypothetical protein GMRT_16324 [Giardia muris]|uniref:Uncharacterized protein n=1 Tax=Giardia muris TaxID=5742 RepID=A0A4Z1SVK3_GIAMU|nr:hypothetical protein GMRT_16324 [Giardia muris]|eukprot:TNJ29670.1 hypothetical protein GMRT_16324 [Giardia muris]
MSYAALGPKVRENPFNHASWAALCDRSLMTTLSREEYLRFLRLYMDIFPTDTEASLLYLSITSSLQNASTTDQAHFQRILGVAHVVPSAGMFDTLCTHLQKQIIEEKADDVVPLYQGVIAASVIWTPYDFNASKVRHRLLDYLWKTKRYSECLLLYEYFMSIPNAYAHSDLTVLSFYKCMDQLCQDCQLGYFHEYMDEGGLTRLEEAIKGCDCPVPVTVKDVLCFLRARRNASIVYAYVGKRVRLFTAAVAKATPGPDKFQTQIKKTQFHPNSTRDQARLCEAQWTEALDYEARLCGILVRSQIITRVEAARRVLRAFELAAAYIPNPNTFFNAINYCLRLLKLGIVDLSDSVDLLEEEQNISFTACSFTRQNILRPLVEAHFSSQHLSSMDGPFPTVLTIVDKIQFLFGLALRVLGKVKQEVILEPSTDEHTPFGVYAFPGSKIGAVTHVQEEEDEDEIIEYDTLEIIPTQDLTLPLRQRLSGLDVDEDNPFCSRFLCMQNNGLSAIILRVLDVLNEILEKKMLDDSNVEIRDELRRLYSQFLTGARVYAFTALNWLASYAYMKHLYLSTIDQNSRTSDAMVRVLAEGCYRIINQAVNYHYTSLVDHEDASKGGLLPIRSFNIFIGHTLKGMLDMLLADSETRPIALEIMRDTLRQESCFFIFKEKPAIFSPDFEPLLRLHMGVLSMSSKHAEVSKLIYLLTDRSKELARKLAESNESHVQCTELSLNTTQSFLEQLSRLAWPTTTRTGIVPTVPILPPLDHQILNRNIITLFRDPQAIQAAIYEAADRDLRTVHKYKANAFRTRHLKPQVDTIIRKIYASCKGFLVRPEDLTFYLGGDSTVEAQAGITNRLSVTINNKLRERQGLRLAAHLDFSERPLFYPLANIILTAPKAGSLPIINPTQRDKIEKRMAALALLSTPETEVLQALLSML